MHDLEPPALPAPLQGDPGIEGTIVVVRRADGVPEAQQTPERLQVGEPELHHPDPVPRLRTPIPEGNLDHPPALALRFHDDLRKDVQPVRFERLDVEKHAATVEAETAGKIVERYREPEAIHPIQQPARGPTAEAHLGHGAAHVPRSDHDLCVVAMRPDDGHEVRGVGEVRVHRDDPITLGRLDAGLEDVAVAGPLRLDEHGGCPLHDGANRRVGCADEDLRTRLDALERALQRGKETGQVVARSPDRHHDREFGALLVRSHVRILTPRPIGFPTGFGGGLSRARFDHGRMIPSAA